MGWGAAYSEYMRDTTQEDAETAASLARRKLRAEQRADYADSLAQLATPDDWRRVCASGRDLSGGGGSSWMAREEVKFLIELGTDDRVTYMCSPVWQFHFIFCRNHQPKYADAGDAASFNSEVYRSNTRRLLVGSVFRISDGGGGGGGGDGDATGGSGGTGDRFVVELNPSDEMPEPLLVRMMAALQRTLTIPGATLAFLPQSPAQWSRAKGAAVATVSTGEIYGEARFQAMTTGEALGHLRLLAAADLDRGIAQVRPGDVVVLEQLPVDLPICAAVVTEMPQAMLCHVALLCSNRRTPNCFQASARQRLAAAGLADGQAVRIAVTRDGVAVEASTDDAVAAALAAGRGAGGAHETAAMAAVVAVKLPVPHVQHAGDSVVVLRNTNINPKSHRVGCKAARLEPLAAAAVSQPTGNCEVLTGLALPFGWFHDMVVHTPAVKAAVDQLAVACLAHKDNAGSEVVAEAARAAQAAVLAAPMPAEVSTRAVPRLLELMRVFHSPLLGHMSAPAWIFRSSTNAEDLAGFSGAGLYESVIVPGSALWKNGGHKVMSTPWPSALAAMEAAIKQVWASLYCPRAVAERLHYGIVDIHQVKMGVLAQPLVPRDRILCSGVAITGNPFRTRRPGIFLNLSSNPDAPITAATTATPAASETTPTTPTTTTTTTTTTATANTTAPPASAVAPAAGTRIEQVMLFCGLNGSVEYDVSILQGDASHPLLPPEHLKQLGAWLHDAAAAVAPMNTDAHSSPSSQTVADIEFFVLRSPVRAGKQPPLRLLLVQARPFEIRYS